MIDKVAASWEMVSAASKCKSWKTRIQTFKQTAFAKSSYFFERFSLMFVHVERGSNGIRCVIVDGWRRHGYEHLDDTAIVDFVMREDADNGAEEQN